MKRKISLLILTILVISTLLVACGSTETYSNIKAENNPCSVGKQNVTIVGTSDFNDEPAVAFKQSISPSDIELGEALVGKTVTKVTYNSATSITVELDGSTKASGGEGVYGTITVKHSGLNSKGNSSCVVNVIAPKINVTSFSSNIKKVDGATYYTVRAKLSLLGGEFAESAAQSVTLAEGATGKLTVSVEEDGRLSIVIEQCSVEKPYISIAADATTFKTVITVKLSMGGSAEIR